jgi:hypothetical protein
MPPPEARSAPWRGRSADAFLTESAAVDTPPSRSAQDLAFIQAMWPFLAPSARERARSARCADPELRELIDGHRVVRIVDGLGLTDGTHTHPRNGRKHWRSKTRRAGMP